MAQVNEKPKIIVILGQTASGKSDLAVQIAQRFNGEVISADSRQVYRGMDIGTGKTTRKEMGRIKHYLLDVASPKKQFSVSAYQKLAKKAIKKILKKSKMPIICGGTGLYIDAVIDNVIFPKVPPHPRLRQKLEKLSTKELFRKLKKLDPHRAENIDKNNRRRLIRALEIVMVSKKPVPPIQKQRDFEVLKIGIRRPAEELKTLIKKRLLKRFRQGMINEVKKLHQQGVGWQRLFDFGLEYRWISLYLHGFISKKEMREKLNKAIRDYANRQMTWFKRDKEIHWVSNQRQAEKLVNKNFKVPSSR
jgi:tRNA dimethylallyltransferase